MTICPTLQTKRLTLRPFCEEDLNAYSQMMDTPELREALRTPMGEGKAEAWTAMAWWLGQWELRGTGHWAVEETASRRFVGRAGLHNPEREDWPGVEVGWALHPDWWGMGYATEAGAEAVRYGFEELGEDRLYSTILLDNFRSQAVAQRLGFELVDVKILSHFPKEPHGIWALDRDSKLRV
ncbi:MAG: GNAT family N-acetyltransferase [Actinomycetota bacterium]|nr:GNAT family N-acetyltransferase [Actinomycetota bacterium]